MIGWRGDIAIDELTFTPGLCPIKTIAVAAGSLQTPPIPTTAPAIAPPHSKKLHVVLINRLEKSVCHVQIKSLPYNNAD